MRGPFRALYVEYWRSLLGGSFPSLSEKAEARFPCASVSHWDRFATSPVPTYVRLVVCSCPCRDWIQSRGGGNLAAIDVSSNVGDDVGLFVGGLSEIEIAAVLSLESSLMLEAVVVEVLVTPPELATVEVPAMPSEVGFVANVVVAVVTSLLQTPSESSIGKTLRICFISDVSTGDMYGTINPMRHEKKDS